jgi:hypothetical protein
MIFVCVVLADQLRWLEYAAAPALRTHLAGPIGFAAPFCSEQKDESPPPAANFSEFRAHARPRFV